MANTTYVFERMSASDAANFEASDSLIFIDKKASDLTVTNQTQTGLTQESITISDGTHTLAFPSFNLSDASNAGQVSSVVDNSRLVVGSSFNDNGAFALQADGTHNTVVYGFNGNDVVTVAAGPADIIAIVHGGDGADSLTGGAGADYIFGGLGSTVAGAGGADTIDGGAGNDHLYGGDFTANVTSSDGADSIFGGTGSDYIQGNAGNDTIDGGDGDDRIFGGADNDTIFGGNGFDTINGNLGNDTIDGGLGNDSLRGGGGNDSVSGGTGQDIILGDLGDDTITGGVGIDQVTGGDGKDVFHFDAGDAAPGSAVNITDASGNAGTLTGFYDTITDYTHGTDKIDLSTVGTGGSPSATVLHQTAGVTFTSVDAAQVYAQQLLDNSTSTTTHEIAAIQVGSDTYLFSNEANANSAAGTTIDSVVHLTGVTASTIDTTDFI